MDIFNKLLLSLFDSVLDIFINVNSSFLGRGGTNNELNEFDVDNFTPQKVGRLNSIMSKLWIAGFIWVGLVVLSEGFSIRLLIETIGYLFVTFIPCHLVLYMGIKNSGLRVYSRLIYSNLSKECIAAMDKCIEASPTQFELQICKLNALLYSGEICKYLDLYKDISCLEEAKKTKYKRMLVNSRCVVSYLKENKLDFSDIYSPECEFSEIVVSVSRIKSRYNENEFIEQVNDIFSSKNVFYKCIGALLLAEIYSLRKDLVSQQQYIEKALDFSPSEEVTQCIQKHIYAMNNQIKIT